MNEEEDLRCVICQSELADNDDDKICLWCVNDNLKRCVFCGCTFFEEVDKWEDEELGRCEPCCKKKGLL